MWLSKAFQAPGAKVALFQKSDLLLQACGRSIKWVSPQMLSPLELNTLFTEGAPKRNPLLVYLGAKSDAESFWALQLDDCPSIKTLVEELTKGRARSV